jgi:hypothetical protein
MTRQKTGLSIDPGPNNNGVQLAFCFPGAKIAVLTGIPPRQARAIANRILQELDFREGKRARRPSSPHIFYDDFVEFSSDYLERISDAR